jgi:thiamine-phosphate pyrophosphorylase
MRKKDMSFPRRRESILNGSPIKAFGDDKRALLRGMDANFNRAKEALRVLEDISRFYLEKKTVTSRLKKLRHALTQSLLKFPVSYRQLLESRDSAGDIGRKSWITDSKKTELSVLWVSNMKRAQEAMRVMEEFSKAICAPRSSDFQKIRFALYELEKKSFRFF